MIRGLTHNPFSVQRLGPGNVEYRFASGESLQELADRMAASQWRGELVGAHGTGKSTLLVSLQREADRQGLKTLRWQCRRDARALPPACWWRWSKVDVIFLDGAEAALRWQRRLLMWWARCLGKGLLLTSHGPLDWGLRFEVLVRPEQFQELLSHLVGGDSEIASLQAADALLRSHGGCAREALFALYDSTERTGRPSLPAPICGLDSVGQGLTESLSA